MIGIQTVLCVHDPIQTYNEVILTMNEPLNSCAVVEAHKVLNVAGDYPRTKRAYAN